MTIAENLPVGHLTRHLFVNAPFERLRPGGDLLDLFLRNQIRPEIGLEGDCLWNTPSAAFKDLAHRLEDAGLACTLHAPFHDLVPGGFDTRIIALTREKLRRAFDLLAVFKPRSIVCHLGYEEHKHADDRERWLEVSSKTWKELMPQAAAAGVPVMFENTYETGPEIHSALFSRLKAHSPRFCLDTGHVLAFSSTPWQDWLRCLGPWLGQLHLHDNDGNGDSHMAVGDGRFDFRGLFLGLKTIRTPLLFTLEIRSRRDLRTSFTTLDRLQFTDLL